MVGGEHWRAVLLVVRGKWTCNDKHWLERKLQGQKQGLTRRDLWTRTEAPVTALLGRFTGPMCGCRPIMTGRGG